MLLSIFISFLLARRFSGKIYVPLIVVAMILISISSVGWITIINEHRIGVEPQGTLPLSFPFNTIKIYVLGSWPVYSLRFLEFQIIEVFPEHKWLLSSEQFLLIYTFFLLVNIVGILIGYWMKTQRWLSILKKVKV